ncbi:MAG: HPr family phosphocarrier protein [Synergistaceae bacterium]|jgi:phosphocarrier protein|nr:HPr family phosphocarrier protein [Synergistaceae bacterium]
MFEENLTIKNKTGLHARPASDLVSLAQTFSSKIRIRYGERTVDPKSIISLLSGGVKQGAEIELTAEGDDEQRAGRAIADFINALEE